MLTHCRTNTLPWEDLVGLDRNSTKHTRGSPRVQRAFNDKVLAVYRSLYNFSQFATIFIAILTDSSTAKPCV